MRTAKPAALAAAVTTTALMTAAGLMAAAPATASGHHAAPAARPPRAATTAAAPVTAVGGLVVDGRGRPVPAQPVVLLEELAAAARHRAAVTSGVSPTVVLARSRSDAAGRFTLRVRPRPTALPRVVTVMVGDGPRATLVGELDARGRWQGPPLRVVVPSTSGRAAEGLARSTAGRGCPVGPAFFSWWQRQRGAGFLDRAVVVGRTATGARTRVRMTYQQSTSTSASVFATGGPAGELLAVGQQRLAESSAATVFATPPRTTRSYLITTRYWPWDLRCQNLVTGATWTTPTYQWRPDGWTGGTGYLAVAPAWRCRPSNSTDIATALTVGRAQSFTDAFVAGVSWRGVGGTSSVTAGQGTAVSLTVSLWRARTARLCGRDDVPARSLELKEVAR